MEAHLGRLPSDAIYEVVVEVLSIIPDCDDADSANDSIISCLEPDCYNNDLATWLGSNNSNWEYLDIALQEKEHFTGFDLLQRAQSLYKMDIADCLINSINTLIGTAYSQLII